MDAIVCSPEIVLVPLLAFDIQLNRLGYGGGFYDRTLTNQQIKIGVAFECMRVECVPTEPHDIRLDYIVTESGVY